MTSDSDPQDSVRRTPTAPRLEVDATGLRCPLPLLKAKQALNQLRAGETVKVTATDVGSVRDFHAFAELSGHLVVHFAERDGVYEYVLQKQQKPTESQS